MSLSRRPISPSNRFFASRSRNCSASGALPVSVRRSLLSRPMPIVKGRAAAITLLQVTSRGGPNPCSQTLTSD